VRLHAPGRGGQKARFVVRNPGRRVNNNQPGLPDPALPPSLARCPDIPVAGLKRDKKDFSKRQLSLSQKQYMSCRHCNESEKDEAKANRRKSLDESRQLKGGEVHNKGAQVHQTFKGNTSVA
jgi:hypothetical protein